MYGRERLAALETRFEEQGFFGAKKRDIRPQGQHSIERGNIVTTSAAGNLAGNPDKDKEKVEKRRALGRGLASLLPGPRILNPFAKKEGSAAGAGAEAPGTVDVADAAPSTSSGPTLKSPTSPVAIRAHVQDENAAHAGENPPSSQNRGPVGTPTVVV